MPYKCTPLHYCSNRQPVIDRQCSDAVAREFDSRIEHLVLVGRAAQRDDEGPSPAVRLPRSSTLTMRGTLPPRCASGPECRSVRSDDWRPDAPNASIHVPVAVRRDREGITEGNA